MLTIFGKSGLSADILDLYHESFPADERQPDDQVAELVKTGMIVVHTTRNLDRDLIAFSFTSLHPEAPAVNLDFISVAGRFRGQGEGSRHFSRLLVWVKSHRTAWTALTLEMERRGICGITDEQSAERDARARFYTRLGATQQPVDYNILNFEDPDDRIPAEFWAVVLRPEFDLKKTVIGFYMSPGGYERQDDDPAVEELRRQF